MIDHILAPENALFAFALGFFLLIFLVQAISFIVGMEPFSFLDGLLPDAPIDLDVPDVHPVGFMDAIMSMLKLGKVPFIFTFIIFLFCFSLIGIYGQLVLDKLGLPLLPWFVASPVAFLATIPCLRVGNALMAKVLPKDETYSISSDTFVGRMSTITIGTATHEIPAEAKLQGPDKKTYYVRVVADEEGTSFSQGDQALIVSKRSEGLFTVIQPDDFLL
ncbi:OB-fold-containig protein [Pelagicoccus sp. SDUM812003]|uniref:OB-fold-containig protein n=1 Tax=Pelagicoccus sp. SDUM812003 TaxID=3041267 RepID=UPI00280E2BB6|nr:OB-fold-containig protein [Pelagicoccus sp. SDUM812003]MDQ8205395.1 DUF1449 family protein [Pelagicoccus sp. SDUM812003]